MLLRKIVDDEINASQKLTELPESRLKLCQTSWVMNFN